MNADILDGMRGVARFMSWFLLVPYFAVQLIPARPVFQGVSQEFYDRLRGQSIVAMIAMLLALPCIFPFLPQGKNRVSDYLFAAIASSASWAVAVAWLKSLDEREYRAEFNLMATWKRCAFGLSTLMMIITLNAAEADGRPSPKQLHLHCNDAAIEVTADECSAR